MLERFAGRYLLLRPLGEGGMGQVFLARDLSSGGECAVKRLRAEEGDLAPESLRHEFEALVRVAHPAVVAVHDYGVSADGEPYLVMEYVPGLPAERTVKPGDWRAACFVAAEVADGLDALHRAEVFHGDLKPPNVLVSGSSASPGTPAAVKLLDFGLAGLRRRDGAGHRGTPGFAAPEVVTGAPPSSSADLYGLGATLFALLAGEPPFGGATGDDRLRAQRAGPPSAQRLESLGIPAALIELVLRLMAPEPAERPQRARDVRLELERIHPAARRSLADRLGTAVLVGRERELALLERWRNAGEGGARMVWIEGDAGAGKSSLLAELGARATLAGEGVVRLSCATLAAPGAVARAVLRALLGRLSGSGARGIPERAARWIGGDEPLAAADLGLLVETGVAACAAPVLVLLDDAEELEARSAAWLRRVALHPEARRLRWMLARRSATLAEEDRLLVEAGRAIRIELGPLAEAAVGRLASERLHAPVPRELHEYLFREAGGHPGLTVELLRAAAGRGAIEESDAGLRVHAAALEPVAGAAGFERMVLERAEREDAAGRRVLEALACCGGPVRTGDLDALVADADSERRNRLIAAGWVVREGDGRLALRSPALAEALWRGMDSETRTRLARLALALPGLPRRQRFRLSRDVGDADAALAHAETSFAESPDPRFAAEVAALAERHDATLAAAWHDRAAQGWRARGRYADVQLHAERSLELAPGAAERDARWVLLSTAVLRTGAPAEVEAVVERALSSGVAGGARAQLLVNRASARAQAGDAAGERADADAALGFALAAEDAVATGLALELAARRAWEEGDLDKAEELSAQAAGAFQSDGHAHGVVRSIGFRGALARRRFRLDEAEKLLQEAVEAARSLENRLPLSEQLLYLSTVRAEAGRWAESLDPSAQAARIALEDGRSSEAAAAIANLAQIEGLLGQPRAARRHARSAVRLCRQFRPDLEAYAWRSLAQAERIAGRLRAAEHAARRATQRAAAQGEERHWCRLELGRVFAARGQWREAREIWGRGVAAGDSLPQALLRIETGRAALRGADLPAARALAEQVAGWMGDHASPFAAALLDLLRGEIAFAEHRSGDAVAAARRALAALAAFPAPAERARAALDLAALVAPGAGLREIVSEWAQLAIRTFERLGDHRKREQALAVALAWHRVQAPATTSARDTGLLERVSWLLHSLTDLEELTRRAMQAAVEQLDAERGVLLLADPDSGRLQPMAEHGAVEAAMRNDAVRYSRRVAQQVTESGGSLLIEDAPSDPRAASESVRALQLRSILCVPMFLGGRTVGAVYLDDSRRTHAFGEAERGLLEGFAHLMAIAIEKSRGHEEVQREKDRLEGENLSLRREIGSRIRARGMIGSSAPMQRVLAMMEHAARAQSTVLITGENGTGKELIARTLHHGSRRHLRPFVGVNCGAIPEGLIEAEMFGILANVATGVRARTGYFVQAHGGTLMLDEIGEAAPRAQVSLLAAIANREITPVGGNRPIAVDVRIIAATNRDLRRLIEEGRFREDLFYRLNVIEIPVPPLRERKADIPALVRHFLAQFAAQQEREVPELSDDFLAVVMQSDWPGNVRALQNYMERVMAMTPGGLLRPDPLPQDMEHRIATIRLPRQRRLPDAVTELELRLIREALERARGNQSQAARELGVSEQALRYRLRRLRLPPARQNQRTRYS